MLMQRVTGNGTRYSTECTDQRALFPLACSSPSRATLVEGRKDVDLIKLLCIPALSFCIGLKRKHALRGNRRRGNKHPQLHHSRVNRSHGYFM